MTTEINIDYYNELKRKADFVDKMISPSANAIYNELEMLKEKANKWDEKEAPFKPTDIGYDDGDWEGSCKCGQCVSQGQFYCHCCGQKLDWSVNK